MAAAFVKSGGAVSKSAGDKRMGQERSDKEKKEQNLRWIKLSIMKSYCFLALITETSTHGCSLGLMWQTCRSVSRNNGSEGPLIRYQCLLRSITVHRSMTWIKHCCVTAATHLHTLRLHHKTLFCSAQWQKIMTLRLTSNFYSVLSDSDFTQTIKEVVTLNDITVCFYVISFIVAQEHEVL